MPVVQTPRKLPAGSAQVGESSSLAAVTSAVDGCPPVSALTADWIRIRTDIACKPLCDII